MPHSDNNMKYQLRKCCKLAFQEDSNCLEKYDFLLNEIKKIIYYILASGG